MLPACLPSRFGSPVCPTVGLERWGSGTLGKLEAGWCLSFSPAQASCLPYPLRRSPPPDIPDALIFKAHVPLDSTFQGKVTSPHLSLSFLICKMSMMATTSDSCGPVISPLPLTPQFRKCPEDTPLCCVFLSLRHLKQHIAVDAKRQFAELNSMGYDDDEEMECA